MKGLNRYSLSPKSRKTTDSSSHNPFLISRTYTVCCTVPGTTEQVSHRRGDTGAVELATKIRLENGNDHMMDKKKAMTAVRSKRK